MMVECSLKQAFLSIISNYLPIHPHNKDKDVSLQKEGMKNGKSKRSD
jgi:hypothetical protein